MRKLTSSTATVAPKAFRKPSTATAAAPGGSAIFPSSD